MFGYANRHCRPQTVRFRPEFAGINVGMDINTAASHWALGDKYFKSQRFREAIDQFRECIWLEPNDPAAHHSLGVAYCELRRFALAVEPFLRAI
jgi:Flp pilus assembly protein TadD